MRVWRRALTAFVVVFLLAPLVVVIVGSVNQNRYLNFPPEGFSLSWYGELFTDPGGGPRSGTAWRSPPRAPRSPS